MDTFEEFDLLELYEANGGLRTSYIDLAICTPNLIRVQELATNYDKIIRASTGVRETSGYISKSKDPQRKGILHTQTSDGALNGKLVTFYPNKWISAWIRLFGY